MVNDRLLSSSLFALYLAQSLGQRGTGGGPGRVLGIQRGAQVGCGELLHALMALGRGAIPP